MLRNHFIILYRNLTKNRLFFLINVFGLSIAIGCCVVAYFNYDFNASFDDIHQDASSVYRVNSIRQGNFTEYGLMPGESSDAYGLVPVPLAEAISQNIKEVELLTRHTATDMNIRVGNEIFKTRSAYVDPGFFKMFTFNFIHGSPDAITDKSKIVISDQLALKYYGHENAVNKVITHVIDNNIKREFEVVGVYALPKINSSFNEDLYSLYDNYWEISSDLESGASWKHMNTLFVSIPDASRLVSVEQQMKAYTENNNNVRKDFLIQEFKLDNFKGMAIRDVASNRPGTVTRSGHPLAAIIGLAVMSVLILLIACFNLANTAIALSQQRLKEIGLRKVMGSVRSQLIFQYIGETLVICFVALALGLIMAESFLLPWFVELWPFMKLEVDYLNKPDFLIFMGGVLFVTGLLAGGYPAFYVSKFNPTQILRGKLQFGGNNFVTYFLLGIQLVLSMCGIVCGLSFTENARWQRAFDDGFSKHTGIITYVDNRGDYEKYRNALSGNKNIVSISGSTHHFQSGTYHASVSYMGQVIEPIIMNVGDDYMKATGMTLTEGRDFLKDSETDRKESVIVTQEMVRQYGWEKALGQTIVLTDSIKLFVVGVAKDVYSVWEPLEPMMLRYSGSENINFVLVKATDGKVLEVDAFMKEKWKTTFPNLLYSSRFMNSGDVEADMVNNGLLVMFLFLGGAALLLSVTGLFTLVSLNVIKRMKEIGVRKVLGASLVHILRIVNTGFVLIVTIASILGVYAGEFLSEVFMSSVWDRHKETTTTTMAVSCIIVFVACALSVLGKTYKTANMNPVDVLKNE
ncbi:MAG TPA: ABC transporter permease [Cyclobacteriaceae bacterium]|nr:ABC transporter permease [Cyclobacteriaceae bacterium]